MASNVTTQETKRKTSAVRTKAAPKAPVVDKPEETPAVTTEPTADTTARAAVSKPATIKSKPELNPEDFVIVRNGFNGRLVYKSRNSGETYVWDEFGSEQEIELRELKHARNSSKAFFINNWFMFDDPDVIEWLGVGMFYKASLSIEEIDNLFSMRPTEVENTIKVLPEGQRETIANRARELVAHGEIDSIRLIEALERSLHVKLPHN